MQALLLPVGLEWYALDTAAVREVVSGPLVVRLPTAPPTVLGLFNLRGEIVPVFDTAGLLGLGGARPEGGGGGGGSADGASADGPSDGPPYAVVVESALGPAAMAAHDLPDVVELGQQAGASELPGALGSFVVGQRLVVLLDVDSVMAPARIGGWAP